MEKLGFKVLMETIEVIEKYKNSIFVIKCSEGILNKESSVKAFIESIALFIHSGIKIVLLHDGFLEIENLMNTIGCMEKCSGKYKFIDNEAIDLIDLALSGRINKRFSLEFSKAEIKSIGISGVDGNLIKAKKKFITDNDNELDVGFIGEIENFNKKLIMDITGIGCIPVISPIGYDNDGNKYLIEPDYAASYISSALNAEKLIILSEDTDKQFNSFMLQDIYPKAAARSEGYFYKADIDMKYAIKAIGEGTREVHIIDGENIENMVLDIFSENRGNSSMPERI